MAASCFMTHLTSYPPMSHRSLGRLAISPDYWLLDFLAGVGWVATGAIAFHGWIHLPAVIPVHFDLVGQADGWGPRFLIGIGPLLGLMLTLALTIQGRHPHTCNYPVALTEQNRLIQYRIARTILGWLKLELNWLLASVTWMMVSASPIGQAALGPVISLSAVLIVMAITLTIGLRQTVANR
jgi:uncharacterized membrane protein